MDFKSFSDSKTSLDNIVQHLPYFIAHFFLAACVVTFSISALQGRWYSYVPTISETAISHPNALIFSTFISVDAILVLILFALFRLNLLLNEEIHPYLNLYGNILTFVCPIQLISLSSCTILDNNAVHFGNAVPFFFLVATYFYFTFNIVKNKISPLLYKIRYGLLITQAISFILMGLVFVILPINKAMTPHSYCEFIFMLSVIAYLVTWTNDLKKIKIDLLVFSL